MLKSDSYYAKHTYERGLQIQKNPYQHLLTTGEKHRARGVIPQLVFDGFFAGLWAVYFLRRSRNMMRIREGKINIQTIIGMSWRFGMGAAIANVFAKKLFKNRERLTQTRIAQMEVKKIMMQMPNAKPIVPLHKKSNYFFIM